MEVFQLVEVPVSLQVALLLAVTYGVRYVLGNFPIPEDKISEIAAGATAVLLSVAGAFLGLIPPEFEPIANAVLQLLAVALGGLYAVRAYLRERKAALLKG